MYKGKHVITPAQHLKKLLGEVDIWKKTFGDLKVLFYDIETTPMKSWHFPLGEQTLRHSSLDKAHDDWDIITIQYCWGDGKEAKVLHWGNGSEVEITKMINEFDKLVAKADVVIGKNSARFDNKHINAKRLFTVGTTPCPTWLKHTDDLEQQFRKHFKMPSQALDYYSTQLGLGGKVKMEFQDWIDIVNHKKLKQIEEEIGTEGAKAVCLVVFGYNYKELVLRGKAAFSKMVTYGKKDAIDTRSIWVYSHQHFEPKHNHSNVLLYNNACKTCGSKDIIKNGVKGDKQRFFCNAHWGYAGQTSISASNKANKVLK
jgi:DNA polymerase elongation subunit (family B)